MTYHAQADKENRGVPERQSRRGSFGGEQFASTKQAAGRVTRPAYDRVADLADTDYKLETMHLLIESFKTKMRTDFEATFQSVDKKSRLVRKELLEHLNEALEDVEDRVSKQTKFFFHESQLADIDFRKTVKSDVFLVKADVDSLGRMSHDRMEELERRLRLTESFYREVKAELNDVLESKDKRLLLQSLDEGFI